MLYMVNSGQATGQVIRPEKWSKCGSFAFFSLYGTQKRVHKKHLTSVPNPQKDYMQQAKLAVMNMAKVYVDSEGLIEIETLRNDLEQQSARNMELVRAIRAGTGRSKWRQNTAPYAVFAAGMAIIAILCLFLV